MQRWTVYQLTQLKTGELHELERRTRLQLLVATEAGDRGMLLLLQDRMRMVLAERKSRGDQLRLW